MYIGSLVVGKRGFQWFTVLMTERGIEECQYGHTNQCPWKDEVEGEWNSASRVSMRDQWSWGHG